ncbi:DUF3231 family protein [Paenibacillus silviterrae]|uniref:DUF3231 family protein n=1 Tax=Paenibacillus silviterrae TaxID=3242194 RepID=UPI0025436AAD|nr:DUF3231 family protein [Paenibacillus chinjuensis]
MTNILETTIDTIKALVDEKDDQPLHAGEVMGSWIYLAGLELAKTSVQYGINTTTDRELKSLLEEDLQLGNSQRERLHKFLLKEGISLPPSPEDLPHSEPRDVPLGAKLTDDVIANELSLKIASLIMQAATIVTQSIRTDVGVMFLEFQTEKVTFSGKLKQVMRKRGWIRVPPFFVPSGSPHA